jgi:hypothetical protein
MKKFFLVLLVFAVSSVVAQQEMGVLYDPKIPAAVLNIPTTQKQKIAAQAIQFGLSTIKNFCYSPSELDGKTGILEARMTGSFTRPKSQQIAYVTQIPCGTGHSDDYWRLIAIYEGTVLKSGYLVTYTVGIGAIREFYAVKDVNQNGLSEIAVVSVWGDGPGSGTDLDLIDWNTNAPKPLGHLSVSSAMYDDESGKSDVHRYTVYVAKSPKPVFVGLEAGSKTQLTLLPLEKPSVLVIPIR